MTIRINGLNFSPCLFSYIFRFYSLVKQISYFLFCTHADSSRFLITPNSLHNASNSRSDLSLSNSQCVSGHGINSIADWCICLIPPVPLHKHIPTSPLLFSSLVVLDNSSLYLKSVLYCLRFSTKCALLDLAPFLFL